jgi:hypothetical protein
MRCDYRRSAAGIQVFFTAALLLRLDHDDLLHPGVFRPEPLLYAPDQGNARHVSTPAEARRGDLYSVALDAGEQHLTAAALVSPAHLRDYSFDLLDVFSQGTPE